MAGIAIESRIRLKALEEQASDLARLVEAKDKLITTLQGKLEHAAKEEEHYRNEWTKAHQEIKDFHAFRDALLALLTLPASVPMMVPGASEELTRKVAREEAQKLLDTMPRGDGRIVRLAPVPALTEIFKDKERENVAQAGQRLLDEVKALTSKQRQLLAVYVNAGTWTSLVEAVRALGEDISGKGGARPAWTQENRGLVGKWIAVDEKRGFKTEVDAYIDMALTSWGATQEEQEAVCVNILALLAQEVDPKVTA